MARSTVDRSGGRSAVRIACQRERLLVEHGLNRRACRVLPDAMLRKQIVSLREDQIGVLQLLESLEAILLAQSHAFADELQKIDDPERKVALVSAQLAMIGVIDRDQGVDLRVACGRELVELELALVLGQGAQVIAHEADRRLMQV